MSVEQSQSCRNSETNFFSDHENEEINSRKATKRTRTKSTNSQGGKNESNADGKKSLKSECKGEMHQSDHVKTQLSTTDLKLTGHSGMTEVNNEDLHEAAGVSNTRNDIDLVIQRNWTSTSFGMKYMKSQYNEKGIDFTIASYNVLAQNLIYENRYLYRNCYDYHLKWEFRSANLLKEFKYYQPDILCLQEVQSDHFEQFYFPELHNLGYEALYKQRTGGRPDGCAIFFKTKVFKLIKSRKVEFRQPGAALLDKDNVAVLALLAPFENKDGKVLISTSKLCIATTHLLFNPRRGDIKLAQLQVLLSEIDDLAIKNPNSLPWKPSYHPVIFCGDLNSEPYSYLYEFLLCGSLKYEGLAAKNISGQKEGSYGRNNFPLDKLLLPQCIGISDQCQKVCEFKLRYDCYLHKKFKQKKKHKKCSNFTTFMSKVSDTKYVQNSSSKPQCSQQQISNFCCDNFEVVDMELCNDTSVSETDDNKKDFHSQAFDNNDLQASVDSAHRNSPCNTSRLTGHNETESNRYTGESSGVYNSSGTLPKFAKEAGEQTYYDRVHHVRENCSHATGTLRHKFEFASVYQHCFKVGKKKWKEEVTTNHSKADCTVDYIFYTIRSKDSEWTRDERLISKHVKEKSLKLLQSLNLFYDQELQKFGGLPNESISSDHVLLMAKFLWKFA